MKNLKNSLLPGNHRPVYLWAGPGTIRMNRLKFMNAPVDTEVHQQAHQPAGADSIVAEAGCNWIYLMYDWGFPPEVEKEDWLSFRQAVKAYRDAGANTFAYIQTSNCAYSGSFQQKNWYALDATGRKIFYYTGRFMTCWRHPDWIEHLKEMIAGALECGADGIFFDNPWYGAQPFAMAGSYFGSAGCHCANCRSAYKAETGEEIPAVIDTHDIKAVRYIRWRAQQVTTVLTHLSDYAKQINPNVVISANDFDAVMRNSYLIYGIDLQALAKIQDVVMIEDYGLPKWHPAPQPRLANNALTIRTARALTGSTPISVDPYDHGIGFDLVYPARRYQQAIAEAHACCASNVIKATEFVDERGSFTLLTAERYRPIRKEIGRYHDWLRDHAVLYQGVQNLASIALLHPGDALWQNWQAVAPRFFGAGQALLKAGIPWRVVNTGDPLDGSVKSVLAFDRDQVIGYARCLDDSVIIQDLSDWTPTKPSRLEQAPRLRSLAAWLVDKLYPAYFSNRLVRKALDGLGIVRLFTGTPLFNLPTDQESRALRSLLPENLYPVVQSKDPVLIEVWLRTDLTEIHLVNYAGAPQHVTVDFGRRAAARCISPDSTGDQLLHGSRFEIDLDIYAVLSIEPDPIV
jgi:hypothetical protein